MDINQSKVSTIATGVKYNDSSTSQTISDTAPQTWSVYVRDAAGNVSDRVVGTSTISSYAVTRSRTVTDGSASDITLTIRYDATSDDSSKPNFADDSKTMYMLHGTPIYIVASAGSGFTLTELKLNDTDILSNKGGYQHDISATTAIKSKASKEILQNQEYVQDVTQQVCDNTTTPDSSIQSAINTSNYSTYLSQHIDTVGTYGVEKEAILNSNYRNYVPEATLKDRRSCDANGENCTQTYIVRKLADGKCWMVQNMELDLEYNTELSQAFSDVAASVTPVTNASYATSKLSANTSHPAWVENDNIARSYNPKYDTSASNNSLYIVWTGSGNGLAYGTSGLYYGRRGNFYNWYAATATSGTSSMSSGDAPSSICPKGFKIPIGGPSNDSYTGTFHHLLVTTYGIPTSISSLTLMTFPLSIPPAGRYSFGGGLGLTLSSQLYWTSTAYSNKIPWHMEGYGGKLKTSINDDAKGYGYSVRCVSR